MTGRGLALLAVLLLTVGQSGAQERPPALAGPEDSELREALFSYFEKTLRTELALSDEQAEQLMPMVREMERQRARMQRERMAATRELRRGYRSGADDDELARLLARVDEIEVRNREERRTMMQEIDQVLSVRQQVRLRGVIQRFRQNVQRRIRELRGGPRPSGQFPAGSPPDRRP